MSGMVCGLPIDRALTAAVAAGETNYHRPGLDLAWASTRAHGYNIAHC